MNLNSKAKFSVAIPVYNRADYLQETIDSILAQTYQATEIVIVDDGSTDNSWDVIQSYGSQLKSVQIENSGAGNARRVAVEHCSCPWIAFCDSDDIWLPNHLERRASLIKAYPNTSFSFSDMKPFGDNAIEGKTYFSDGSKEWWANLGRTDNHGFIEIHDTYRKLLSFNPVAVPTIIISRELYKKIGGIDAQYSRMPAEDADLTRRAVAKGHVHCDTKVTAMQRRHGTNMSILETENMLGKIKILESHMQSNITPEKDRACTLEEINNTKHKAVLSAFYKRNKAMVKPLSSAIKGNELNLTVRLRFIFLKLLFWTTRKL